VLLLSTPVHACRIGVTAWLLNGSLFLFPTTRNLFERLL
jgi:hypothetical protein